jgi:tellurite resistance protein TerC
MDKSGETMIYFPFVDYWWVYGLFLSLVASLITLDLGVFHKKSHAVGFKEAAIWSVVWVSLALIFNVGFYYFSLHEFQTDPRFLALANFNPVGVAKQLSLEFLAGYVVEKTLAVDNLFVFVIIFSYFSIPPKYQHKLLFWGILGALFFRAIFISIGAVLMQYHEVVILFGVFLIFTGLKIGFSKDEETNPGDRLFVKWLRKILPMSTRTDHGHFFVKEDSIWKATPLFLALVVIEVSDIIFAVDSVPAIFAITKEPLVVFTSNIFAILGIRSLYFLLAGVIQKFHLLKYGLAVILVFVGLKMVWLNNLFDGKFPISWSLLIIFGVLLITGLMSIFFPPSGDKGHK